jgi:hypothetical protein
MPCTAVDLFIEFLSEIIFVIVSGFMVKNLSETLKRITIPYPLNAFVLPLAFGCCLLAVKAKPYILIFVRKFVEKGKRLFA